jgi:hypothetical protein
MRKKSKFIRIQPATLRLIVQFFKSAVGVITILKTINKIVSFFSNLFDRD